MFGYNCNDVPSPSPISGAPAPEQVADRPRVIRAASADEAMIEFLKSLIAHVNGVFCGCEDCQRYLKARELLLPHMST